MTKVPATKEEFKRFVDKLTELNIVNKSTAENIQVACKAIETSIPDGILATEWDLDAITDSYRNSNDIKEQTAKTYYSRFKSAVDKFKAYAEGRELKPVTNRKYSKNKNSEVEEEAVKTFSLPIPLREALIVNIDNLPRDLSIDEAERIAVIIKSYAIRQ
ncbi:hypothetical protein QE177_09125 [Arsenophonus sp. aPb]|uniref:hypothetical protein n=1 Tax=Arsenophonus sp. aPb TaxID=3041619 RepID=UPI0024695AE4|nr:hypothetical protein [Arsenophonus sp. aPb]WGL97383.1 hypothetical protein QE177_09125 [Arsenophonus sp. aPb]